MRYKISSFDHLKARLAELKDDPTKHWSEYPCLLWDRSAGSYGYGQLGYKCGGSRSVHRIVFELIYGKLPKGIDACHHCDVRLCFRPIHLFAGTRAVNLQDCVAKGRNRYTTYPGTANHNCKLTENQVREIRAIGATREISHERIAKLFSVSQVLVSLIIRRRAWRHLD